MCSNFILNYKLSIIKTSFFIINICMNFTLEHRVKFHYFIKMIKMTRANIN